MSENFDIKLAKDLIVGDKIVVDYGTTHRYLEIREIKKTKSVVKVYLDDTSYSYRPSENVAIL